MSDLTPSSNCKRWLITLSGAPRSVSAVRAGADLALAAGAFGQQVTLVFSGTGLELLKPAPALDESLYRLLGSLPFYEIEKVHALTLHGEHPSFRSDLPVVTMTPDEWVVAAAGADIVVNY
ncbi:MAG: DsrE family protein [Pseudomonadota bacterium]|nr:DsrE family protein [Pseudomonadota bacterium]